MAGGRVPGAAPGIGWATCSTPLRAWINATRSRIEDALGPAHVGTYLHGSLASGSFRPPKSDVDVIFVVEGSLDVPQRHQVARAAALMNTIRPIVGSLEFSVVRRDALARPVHPLPYEVHFGEEMTDPILSGIIDLGGKPLDFDLAAHIQATCEFGIALSGPPVGEIFTPPPRADFLDAIRGDLAWILEDEHILESPYYGILNVSRILWVLEGHSDRLAPSKEEAGEWMLEWVPDGLRGIVGLALAAYRDEARVSDEDRRTAGLEWPREALLDFRDWARERTRGFAEPPFPPTDRSPTADR
jgi:streptomycin 3"-adenylyltransferase